MKLRLLRTSTIALAAVLAWTIPAQAAGTVFAYMWAPSPIASAASLAASSTVAVAVTAVDNTGTAIPGATVFLSIKGPGPNGVAVGTATNGQAQLNKTAIPFVTDANGKVTVTYKTPATPPLGGKDVLVAGNTASSPTIKSTSEYCYGQVVRYVQGPKTGPIAPPASLTAGQQAPVTFTAVNASNQPVANVPVYIRFSQQSGGGTATVGTTAIGQSFTTPSPFSTNINGQITVAYTAANNVATNTGIDEITLQDAATSQCVTKRVKYSYAGATRYLTQLTPIAATGTLPANFSVLVQLTALDATGAPVVGAQVYLSMNNQGGSTALVGRIKLASTPTLFSTNSSGRVTITYITPLFLPGPGIVDTVIAGNLASNPTVSAQDTYTY